MMRVVFMAFLLVGCLSHRGDPLWEIQIERGDTLQKIADQFDTSVDEILAINDIRNPHFLTIGKILVIPRQTYLEEDSKPVWPVTGTITSHYGKRGTSHHDGMDIATESGRRITAALSGNVVFAGYKNGYGKTVIVDHGEWETLYAHCSRLFVERGQFVDKSQVIAAVGETGRASGPHLHFEWRNKDGSITDPRIAMKMEIP